jgi:UDP-N-acetyl-D-mannosaminuronate dehydrogenase
VFSGAVVTGECFPILCFFCGFCKRTVKNQFGKQARKTNSCVSMFYLEQDIQKRTKNKNRRQIQRRKIKCVDAKRRFLLSKNKESLETKMYGFR